MTAGLDLFEEDLLLRPVPMPDAAVRFMHSLYRQPESGALLLALTEEIAWRQESLLLWNQERLQPRLSAWYGEPGGRYAYSGRLFHPLPWTPTLLRMKSNVEHATGHRYNSVLLNLYRDENDSVGWHSDAEPELGNAPIIASVSLGETRVFKFRHKLRKELKPLAIALVDGSLLLMQGDTQRYWQHAIMKERKHCGPRINLTFRQIRLAE